MFGLKVSFIVFSVSGSFPLDSVEGEALNMTEIYHFIYTQKTVHSMLQQQRARRCIKKANKLLVEERDEKQR